MSKKSQFIKKGLIICHSLVKICLEKENIVLRFNYNPFLLEEEFDIINSFEEDCMFPTKYIVRNMNDVEYVKKIVNKIKK